MPLIQVLSETSENYFIDKVFFKDLPLIRFRISEHLSQYWSIASLSDQGSALSSYARHNELWKKDEENGWILPQSAQTQTEISKTDA